jgi:hypothetical protein
MTTHTCDERCSEPCPDGGLPDCPVFRIQYALWHLQSELELLEREINEVLDLREE